MADSGKDDAWGKAAGQFYDFHAAQKVSGGFSRAFIRSYRGLAKRLRLSQGMKLLDAGCGTGELAEALLESGVRVTGIDISEESLRLARQRKVNAVFIRAGMAALPFETGSFDAAAAITSLEFCENKKAALNEIKRILKPGGIFYAEVRNAGFVLNRLPLPLQRFFEKIHWLTPYPAEGFRDLECGEWRELFREAGFFVESEQASLRPWNYGPPLTRCKNLLIECVKKFFPLHCHYMTGFFCRS